MTSYEFLLIPSCTHFLPKQPFLYQHLMQFQFRFGNNLFFFTFLEILIFLPHPFRNVNCYTSFKQPWFNKLPRSLYFNVQYAWKWKAKSKKCMRIIYWFSLFQAIVYARVDNRVYETKKYILRGKFRLYMQIGIVIGK